MNPKPHTARRRSLFQIEAEGLEKRELLTGGAGNTFAIAKGTIAAANGTAAVPFTVDTGHFTAPRSGRLSLGIDTVANSATGSKLAPVITSVGDARGHLQRNPNAKYVERAVAANLDADAAMIATVKLPRGKKATPLAAMSSQVNLKGLNGTSGDYLVGFYLPGDANGDGAVTKTDLATIKAQIGKTVNDSGYGFDADTNRDGRISRADLNLAQRNLGASTTITPDIGANLDAATDTGNADRITNQPVVSFNGNAAPGAAITYHEVSASSPDLTTTADAQGQYSVTIPLAEGTSTFQVTSVDAFGQVIQGQIQPVTYTTSVVPTTAS